MVRREHILVLIKIPSLDLKLLDKLESKMEDTTMEGMIPSLFQGQYVVKRGLFYSFEKSFSDSFSSAICSMYESRS